MGNISREAYLKDLNDGELERYIGKLVAYDHHGKLIGSSFSRDESEFIKKLRSSGEIFFNIFIVSKEDLPQQTKKAKLRYPSWV